MNHSYNYSNFLVAFLDILGQKDAFKGLPPMYEGDIKTREKIEKAHSETALFIDTFRESITNIFKGLIEDEPAIQVPEDKKDLFLELRKAELGFHQFSDCIEVFVPLERNKYYSPIMNGVHGLFIACCGMLLFSLAERKSFRAGIEVGIGTQLENGEVYGPVLYKAYELENKIAKYPRIIVGPMTLNFLKSLSNKTKQFPDQIEIDIELCKSNADNCLNLIKRDFDGIFILDFLGKEMSSYLEGSAKKSLGLSYEKLIDMAFNFVESEYRKYQKICDTKLAEKYFLLRDYFLSRLTT